MRAIGLAVVAVAASLVAAPASAALVVVTYTGTASGTDNLGYFGTAGGVFTDAAFTAVFQFDTDLGNRTTNPLVDSLSTNFEQPLTFANFTIGGQTFAFGQIDYGQTLTNQLTQNVVTSAQNSDPIGSNMFHSQMLSMGAWFTPAPVAIDVFAHAEGDLGASQAEFRETTILDHDTGEFTQINSLFDLSVASYDVYVTGGIPEPGTWALMILGFGATGAALRRRKAITA